MVHTVSDCPTDEKGIREVTLRYDINNENDRLVFNKILECLKEQPLCGNCENYQEDGCMCGYNSHSCKIHGNLEWFDHPHHDGDGSKCPDYYRVPTVDAVMKEARIETMVVEKIFAEIRDRWTQRLFDCEDFNFKDFAVEEFGGDLDEIYKKYTGATDTTEEQ